MAYTYSFVLSILIPLSSHVGSINSAKFWWNDIFSVIYIFHFLIIDTNTWLCICLFLKSNDYIKWTAVFNIDTRKALISYKIIIVWCIQTIWFTAVDVWVNSSMSLLISLGQNRLIVFSSWWHKRYIDLFFDCKTVPQYNPIELENWEDVQFHHHQ